jgi:integrase
MPLALVRRPKSPNWIIRGTLRGVRVEESTGVSDRKVAEEIRARRESEILEQSIYGRRSTATFAEAALSYLENGGAKRFLEPVIRHFGATSLAKIDQDAIDRGARKLYSNASAATRNRQFYTPVSAVMTHAAKRRLRAPLLLDRPKIAEKPVRWLKPDEANRLIAACSPHLKPLVIFMLGTGSAKHYGRTGPTLT